MRAKLPLVLRGGERIKVLLMIDKPNNRHAATVALLGSAEIFDAGIIAALEGADYRVHGETDLPEFFARVDEIGPDILLVDCGGNEDELGAICQRLAEVEATRVLPMVAVIERTVEVGSRFDHGLAAIDYISKPLQVPALLAVVGHSLAGRRKADDAGLAAPEFSEDEPLYDDAHRVVAEGDSPRERFARIMEKRLVGARTNKEALKRLLQSFELPELRPELAAILHRTARAPVLSGMMSMVPMAEVLQLLALQRQTGYLRVRHNTTVIHVALDAGRVRLVTGENIPRGLLLGNILIREKFMEPGDLELLLNNRHGARRLLGSQVVKLGYLAPEQLQKALRLQSAELVYEVLRWKRGDFAFEAAERLGQAAIQFDINWTVDELLMEGFRRVDEWSLIEAAIPSFDAVPHIVPGALDARVTTQELRDEEAEVLHVIDGRRTMDGIIKKVGGAPFDVARILYRLVAARIVTVDIPKNDGGQIGS